MIFGLHHSGGYATHIVRFAGLETTPWLVSRGNVHVKVNWIPHSGFKPLLRPITIIERDFDCDGETLNVAVPYAGPLDAYTVELTVGG